MNNYWEYVINAAIASGAGFSGWLMGRKREKTELKVTELDNVEKALGIYRAMLNELHVDLVSAKGQVDEIKKTCNSLEVEIAAMRKRCTTNSCPNYMLKNVKTA
jgi:hypothetical protein